MRNVCPISFLSPFPGVSAFDLECEGDPNQAPEYAMQIFQYYKDREAMFKVSAAELLKCLET